MLPGRPDVTRLHLFCRACDGKAGPALLFDLIQGLVCGFVEVAEVHSVQRIECRADTEADLQFMAVVVNRRSQFQ